MDLKNRLQELMDKRKWTKYKLAKESGLYITTINTMFSKKNYNPSLESIESICNAFDITLAEFFSGVDETNLTSEQLVILEKYERIPKTKRNLAKEYLDILAKD